MAASFFVVPYQCVVVSGLAVPGATLTFYQTGTTTKLPIYTTDAMTVERSNPVVADSSGRIPNTYLNESQIYRVVIKDKNGALLEDFDPYIPGETILGVTITLANGATITTKTALGAVGSPVNGQMAMLTEARWEGMFVFNSSNLSAQVTADPYEAVYVAPDAAPTGASGAWVRQVPDNTYHVEWWLPSTMPINAQVQLNSMDAMLPDNAALLMPNRQVTVTGEWVARTPGLVVWGTGYNCPVYGNSGAEATQIIVVAGSNQRWHNVWAGGTYGVTPGESECPAWHIYCAQGLERSEGFHSVSNTHLLNCGAINAMGGCRVGYAVNTTGYVNYPSKNCRVEGFKGENIHLLGMEIFATASTKVIEPIIKMGTRYGASAQYGMRLVGNYDFSLNGGDFTGLDETTDSTGIWLGAGDNESPGFTANRDTKIENVNLENFGYGVLVDVVEGACELNNVSFSGRTDGDSTFLFAQAAGSTFGKNKNISSLVVRGGVVHNSCRYANIGGDTSWVSIRGATFVSNANAAAEAVLFTGSSGESFTGEVIGNRFARKQNANPPFRFTGTFDATFNIQIDDNDVIPNSAATALFWERYGPTSGMTIRTKCPGSNRSLASTRWAAERPALDVEDYT